MDPTTKTIRDYYNTDISIEWSRIANRPEFLLTCRMLDRYIKPGQTVLDIGGGPGRYSHYLAAKGCQITLLDLSEENTKFALEEAARQGLSIQAIAGDARLADTLLDGQFDHVLLMGPLYHLLEEKGRIKSVNAALAKLKPGGILYAAFINMYAAIIYGMRFEPEYITSTAPFAVEYFEKLLAQKSFAGDAFTKAFFIEQGEILPFMAQFPLQKLHLLAKKA